MRGGDLGKVAEESELGPRQSRAAAILCDVISFNASISSCERTSLWQPALALVRCMNLWFIQSSIISFNAPCKNMADMRISGSVSGSGQQTILVLRTDRCGLGHGSKGLGVFWASRLRSGSAHWDPELAVEARQCPLRSGARSWGPAVPTEMRNSHLGSEAAGGEEGGEGEGGSNSDKIRKPFYITCLRNTILSVKLYPGAEHEIVPKMMIFISLWNCNVKNGGKIAILRYPPQPFRTK